MAGYPDISHPHFVADRTPDPEQQTRAMRPATERYRAAAQLRWEAAQQLIRLGDVLRARGGNHTLPERVGYRAAKAAYEQATILLELSYQEVLAESKIP